MPARFRLIFTPAGGVVLVLSIIILVRSLLARNSYEILLSSAALLFLLVTGIIGAWKARKLEALEPGWKPPSPMTANAGGETLISGLDVNVPLFFRLHFIVRGRFFPGGGGGAPSGASSGRAFAGKGFLVRLKKLTGLNSLGCPAFAETSVSRGQDAAQFVWDFPMSGVFQGEGYCRLRDIFGFFSFACGQRQKRTIKVRSSPCFGKEYLINAQSGAEDRRNKHSTNEERYYMREYTPGDRFRDINWKSSEKIDALITRISPDNQEKVTRIDVYFRNFSKEKIPSLESLWLLDRAKARLSHFLRSLKEQQPSFVFDVKTAQGRWEIEDKDDLDVFLEELAGLSFSPLQNETASAVAAGDLYVFSTACDYGLPHFVLASAPRPVTLFLVQPVLPGTAEAEHLHKLDFFAKGCAPLPRWMFGSRINYLGAQANKMEIIYAETRL
jgi:hypothetical protein